MDVFFNSVNEDLYINLTNTYKEINLKPGGMSFTMNTYMIGGVYFLWSIPYSRGLINKIVSSDEM